MPLDTDEGVWHSSRPFGEAGSLTTE